ncbi:MAG: hypothetical protein ABI723_03915 [Bacteroidia bacterium]
MFKNSLSLIVIVLIGAFLLKTIYTDKFWRIDFVIKSDAVSYYEYLTATLIEKDLSLQFVDDAKTPNHEKYMYQKLPGNINFNKYTCGMAIMHSPFFLIAYSLAPYFDQPRDGYADIFEIALLVGCIFYSCLGLFFLRKVLLRYFKDSLVAMTIIIIAIGTNLMLYTTGEPGMTHPYSFCMISIFMWFVIKWYEKPGFKNSLFLGISGGLVILLRPSDAIVWMLFPLFNVGGIKQFNERILFLLKHFKHLAIILLMIFVVLAPQLYYWKCITGHWFFYSYGNEGFYFTHPHIIDGLFGYRNGWFVYTPIMIFAVTGFFLLRKYVPEFALFIPVFFILNTYIILSWWCWWYSGCGNRAFIDSYGIMALPICATFKFISQNSVVRSFLLISVISLLTYINWYQQWQYKYGLLHWAAMTKESYWAIFMKDQKPAGYDNLLKEPDNESALKYGRESREK